MDLALNKVLVAPSTSARDQEPARFTIVEYEYGSDMVVLCQQIKKSPRKPFVHRIGSPIKFLHEGYRHVINWDAFSLESQGFMDGAQTRYYRDMRLSQNIPRGDGDKIKAYFDRCQKLEDKVKLKLRTVEAFEQFPQRRKAFFNGDVPTKSLHGLAKSLGVSYDFVWDTLCRYYAYGQCEDALIPAYGNCGKNTQLPADADEARRQFPKGRGRTSKSTHAVKRIAHKGDAETVKRFKQNDLPTLQYHSMKSLCRQYNAKYATELLFEDELGNKYWDYVPEKYLTPQQFITRLEDACKNRAEFERIKRGAKEFRNKLRIKKSTVMKHVVGPSHMYEIDATVLDVHLVSKFCTEEKLVIERPILYTVIDVATTMIVGFHLSLNGANAESVTLALFNAMTEKESFCKQWGFDYRPGDWPCHHVCHTLVIDRGAEYLDKKMAALIKSKVGLTSIQITEAYVGRAKGTVEGLFNKLNRMCIHALPGALIKGRPKAKADTSNHACYTIDDLYHILVHEVIAYNKDTVVKKKLTQEHLLNGVSPTPLDLWNWGLEELMGGGKTVDPKSLMSELLPKRIGVITDSGLKLKKEKITYQTDNKKFEEFRQEIVLQRYRSGYEVEVMMLPSWNQHLWLKMGQKSSDIITFEVADTNELVKNLHFSQAIEILKELSVFESNARHINAIEESIRVKRQIDIASSNIKQLRGLLRSEGKSPAKGRAENTNADRYAQAQHNASIVQSAISGFSTNH